MALNTTGLEGELPGYPIGDWTEGQFVGQSKLVITWSTVATLLADLSTSPTNQFPYSFGPTSALARRARVEPLGGRYAAQNNALSSVEASYEKAVVTVWYSTKGPRYNGSDLYEEWFEPSGKVERVDTSLLEWYNDGTSLKAEVPHLLRPFPSVDYCQKWFRLASIPAWAFGRIGYINSNSVTAPVSGVAFAAKTLLYKPPEIRISVTLGKVSSYDLICRYGYDPNGWDKVWRPSAAAYQTVRIAGGGAVYSNFPTAAF